MTFTQQLAAAWQKNNSLLCVGLDPDPAKFPAHLKGRDDAIFEFCAAIVDATADLVCSFKPQIAYFAARRAEDQLEALIAHIHEKHPGIPVILDAKRGDIAATVKAGRTAARTGLMINSSRAILYAGQGEDFASAARRVADETRSAINLHR